MNAAESNPILKCKKCKDIFIAERIASHACYKLEDEPIKSHKIKTISSIDRQCCVVEGDNPCTNSITCKIHSLEQKNQIKGRLYPVEILIQIFRKENAKKKEIETEIKEPVDDQILQKVCKIIHDIKPIVNYHFDNQKFLRENTEICNIFSHLVGSSNNSLNNFMPNLEKPVKKDYNTKKKQIKNAIKTKDAQLL